MEVRALSPAFTHRPRLTPGAVVVWSPPVPAQVSLGRLRGPEHPNRGSSQGAGVRRDVMAGEARFDAVDRMRLEAEDRWRRTLSETRIRGTYSTLVRDRGSVSPLFVRSPRTPGRWSRSHPHCRRA